MKTFFKKKSTQDTPKDEPHIEESLPKEQPQKSILRIFLNIFATLIPSALFLFAVPYLIIQTSGFAQKLFVASNFSIIDPTNAFDDLKKDPTLRQDGKGFTNILIVGIDTRASGSRLLNTDTIILASYNHSTNEVAMVSFPRDLNVNYPNTPSIGKINATYAYGEMRKKGGGMEYLRQLIESISSQKIQYHIMVDLRGFTRIINLLGGVDIYVDPAFTGDYPTESYKWTVVKFKKGMNHMDGARALAYARIRHAYPGSEASDFARARRQQKVIQAALDKATKDESLRSVSKIFEILGTVAGNLKINRVTPADAEAGLLILANKGKPTTYSMVLDPGAAGYGTLVKRGPGYLYNLQPSAGVNNWSKIRAYLKDYAAAPMLVTSKKTVYVYNKGKKDFSKVLSNLKNRYYYASFTNGGSPKDLPAAGVYAIGGPSFKPLCEYFAKANKTQCYTDVSAANIPKPKNTGVIIVLSD